jgi:Mrp family chromosome partitioning ATPase
VSTVVGSLWASRGSDAAGADEDRAQCEEGADGEAARPGDAKHIVLSFHGQATSPYANAILSLKQAIDRHTRKLQSCVVTVVSASNGDGKSVTAVNLAALCAASGARTLLLDCDLRTPSLAARLVRGNPPSLADIVKSGVALEDAVVHTDMGFDFCGGAGAEENHALETFASPRLIEILSEAKALYEFVILDTSSLLDYPDARAALAASDVAVLVLRSNHTTFSAAQAVVRDIELAGASSLEVVLNRTKPTAHLQSA